MKLPSSRTGVVIATVCLFGVAATACGDDESSEGTAPAASTPAASTPAATSPAASTPAATDAPSVYGDSGKYDLPAASDAPAAGGAVVTTAETDLGTVLVDSAGMTLYMFTPDNQGPSVCEAECAAAWPALAGPATAGDGADASLLGTATRADDGTEQVTYNGWPLYHFAQDAAPGDVNGQGLNGKWYVVDPTGTAIGA